MSGPASQEGESIFKGRVYLGKKSIGILNGQVERAPEPPAPKSMSHGPLGQNTFRETSQGVRNMELDSQRVKCMCCAVHSASQRNSEMDEIPLEITGSILVENRAKDFPRA